MCTNQNVIFIKSNAKNHPHSTGLTWQCPSTLRSALVKKKNINLRIDGHCYVNPARRGWNGGVILAFLIYQSYKFFWSRLDNGGDALPSLNSPLYNEEFNLRSLVQQHETLLAKKTKLFFYSFSTKRKWINAIKLKERREFY